jgi:hypothetical protein
MKYLLMFLSLFGCTSCGISGNVNRKPDGAFRYYEYNLSNMRMMHERYYRLDCLKDGTATLSWARNGSDTTSMTVSKEVPEQVNALMLKHKLYKLKKQYRPPFKVLDGKMWYVFIGYDSGNINSGGANAWPPEALRSGIGAINHYLDSLLPARE